MIETVGDLIKVLKEFDKKARVRVNMHLDYDDPDNSPEGHLDAVWETPGVIYLSSSIDDENEV